MIGSFDTEVREAAARTVERDGFAALPALDPASPWFEALVREAEEARSQAWERPSGEAVDHRAWRGPIGPHAQELLASAETRQLLADVVGDEVTPSFEGTCFTYYEGPDDFLGAHRDREGACAYTLILTLRASWPEDRDPGPGLQLEVWGDAHEGPPLAILPTVRGGLVLGRGAEVFHARPPLREGESVWALTACYASTTAGSHANDPELLCEQGEELWQGGAAAEASRCFERALDTVPTSERAWSGLGFARWTEGDFEAALLAFQQAARLDSQTPSHWSNIGLCLRDLGRGEAAIAAFRVALLLDPGYAPAWNEWGNVLQDEGHPEESLPCYAKALGIDPTRAVVHHNLGVAQLRLGREALAGDAFLAALERDPHYPHAREELALLYDGAGRREEALEILAGTESARARELEARLRT